MKLLFCRECSDVVKLHTGGNRSCLCGKVYGRYLEDGWNAVVSAGAEVIGVNNHNLAAALNGGHPDIPAWLFGRDARRIRWES